MKQTNRKKLEAVKIEIVTLSGFLSEPFLGNMKAAKKLLDEVLESEE
jgi:hypothetical protein